MSNDNPKTDDKASLRKLLLVTFLLGLWLLGAISGMLIFNLFNFIHFRSKGHILILIILIASSITLMVISYLFFPREKDRDGRRPRGNG